MQSLQVSSKPPMLHRRALPGAANSGSETTSPTTEKALMLEVATDEVDGVVGHVLTEALQEGGRRVTFLGNFVVTVD